MIEEPIAQETSSEKETSRLEAFSDGVFAVAITLLVFNLKVPTLDAKTITQQFAKIFSQDQWIAYITFFISFATVLIMWVSHHSMFKLIHKSSSLFMFANGFLLLLVTIVPFTSQLLSENLSKSASAAGAACAVYSGLFLIINIAYNLLWWSAAYQHHLLKQNVSPSLIKARTRSYLLGLPSYLIAMVLAFWSPLASIGICSVLWLFWALASYEKGPNARSRQVGQAG